MKKILILICIVFIQKVYAQSDYREGFVILKNGDTISGFINYRITDSQFKKIEFKKTLESKKTEYTPLLIKAYGYKKNELFNSKKIKDSNYDDTFFLETLVSGKITLFRLYDDFYIEKDNILTWLDNKKRTLYRNGKDYIFDPKRYKGILQYLLSDCFKIKKEIKNTKYLESNLVLLISGYNSCNGTKNTVYKENKPWLKVNYGIILGYNFSNYKNDKNTLKNSKGNSNSISFGGFLEIGTPRVIERVSLYTGLIYNSSNFYYYEKDRNIILELEGEYNLLKIPLAIRYTFPQKKITPYITVGFLNSININSFSNWSIENNTANKIYTRFEKFTPPVNTLGYTFGVGFKKKIKGNLEAVTDLNYESINLDNTSEVNSSNYYNDKLSTFQLLIGLRF